MQRFDAEFFQELGFNTAGSGVVATAGVVDVNADLPDETSLVEHQDTVRERHRLPDIVGDEQNGGVMFTPEFEY